ncbi:hypothetical protein F511_22657 [Dorcoceras hygrometricum]|uniref:Uncharacterized protein n=1 Tax=Dorcoceras hygrometricum TaxID=472368 RepID=A0A2Z7BLI6_9LAMI|nr:hypothetical protein F511_22657 [Dorcoceras hygrometricum]
MHNLYHSAIRSVPDLVFQIPSELSIVSATLNRTDFSRHTDVSVVIWVYGIFRTLSYVV